MSDTGEITFDSVAVDASVTGTPANDSVWNWQDESWTAVGVATNAITGAASAVLKGNVYTAGSYIPAPLFYTTSSPTGRHNLRQTHRITSAPSNITVLFHGRNSSTTIRYVCVITTDRRVAVGTWTTSGFSVLQQSGPNVVPLNTPFRTECSLDPTTGEMAIYLWVDRFASGGADASATYTTAPWTNVFYGFGVTATVANLTAYTWVHAASGDSWITDDWRVNTGATLVGPLVDPTASPALKPGLVPI